MELSTNLTSISLSFRPERVKKESADAKGRLRHGAMFSTTKNNHILVGPRAFAGINEILTLKKEQDASLFSLTRETHVTKKKTTH